MLKLFLIILISVPVFAVDAIYAWGYGEDIKNILISIKFFTANATYLIDIAIAIGILLVMYRETKEDNTDRIVKVIFLALVVSQLFFHAKKDYMVEDEVTNQAFAVTDVPIGIGELYSFFTMAERVLLKAFESSYSTPNSLSYSQVGLGFSMIAHLSVQKATFTHGNAFETFMNYTTDCITSGMLDGQISEDIIKSENLFQDLRVNGFETIIINNKNMKVQVSCQDAYDDYLVPFFALEANEFFQYNLIPSMEVIKKQDGLQSTGQMLTGVSNSSLDYVMQEMTKNMFKKGLRAMAMTTGGDTQALAYSMAKSDSLMNNQWQQSGMLAQSTLPMIKAYLTSVILAMTPLLALLSIMFADWKYIKMIITLLITLMFFSPLASIINYLIYLKLEAIAPLMNRGLWMPMLSSGYINEMLISYLNFLGYAAMSIPILAYSLVKASEQGFVTFMSGMGGSISGTASSVASEKVSGVNIGNTKVGGSTVTTSNGTITDMGGGNTKTDLMGKDNTGGVYSGQSMQSANGNYLDTLSNDVASWKANNGKISSLNMDNLSASLAKGQTDTINQAKATEASTMESISNTLSSGISNSMAKGQIFTNSDDFSKNTGLSQADSKSIVSSQNEAIVNSLNSKLSESKNSSTTADAGFKLGGHAGWDVKDTVVGGITGVSAGTNGNFHISGTSTDGKSFSVDMSKDEMANIQKSVSDNLSKTFNQDNGLALRTSQSLADNQVFSSTSLKSNMDAYTKAHSIADKYSENYSKTNSNSSNLDHKQLPQIIERFIEKDERLNGMYKSEDINAQRGAISEATKRIDQAYSKGVGADYKAFNHSYQEVTGIDLKGNISDLVNTQINQGKNLADNSSNTIGNGQSNISNTNVNNSINQNPTSTYQNQVDDFKNNTNKEMNDYKNNTSLHTENYIKKGEEILHNRKKENDDDSRTGKAFSAITIGGMGDIKKGVENLINKDWNKETAYLTKDGKPLPSNDLADVKTQLSYLKDDISDLTQPNSVVLQKEIKK